MVNKKFEGRDKQDSLYLPNFKNKKSKHKVLTQGGAGLR